MGRYCSRSQMVLAVVGLTLALAFPLCASANPLSDAMDALQADDYPKAAKLFLPLAKNGDRIAQSTLGMLYDYGKGVPQDYRKAAKWYLLSIAQGTDGPQVPARLAWMYRFGKGVPQEPKESLKLYRMAEIQGDPSAFSALGDMYYEGEGTTQDFVEAAQWYRLAAEAGETSGQVHLGFMYARGQGVPRNLVLAHMWINIGAANEAEAKTQEAAIKLRDSIAQEMTAEQLTEAQELAKTCAASKFKEC